MQAAPRTLQVRAGTSLFTQSFLTAAAERPGRVEGDPSTSANEEGLHEHSVYLLLDYYRNK